MKFEEKLNLITTYSRRCCSNCLHYNRNTAKGNLDSLFEETVIHNRYAPIICSNFRNRNEDKLIKLKRL